MRYGISAVASREAIGKVGRVYPREGSEAVGTPKVEIGFDVGTNGKHRKLVRT